MTETSRRGFLKKLGMWAATSVVIGGTAKGLTKSNKEGSFVLHHPTDILKNEDGQPKSRAEQLYDVAVADGTWAALLTGRSKERLGVLLGKNILKDTGHQIIYNGRPIKPEERRSHFARKSDELRRHSESQVQISIGAFGLDAGTRQRVEAQVQKNLQEIWAVIGEKSDIEAEKIISAERHKFQEESQQLLLSLGLVRKQSKGNQVQTSGSWTARPGQGVVPSQSTQTQDQKQPTTPQQNSGLRRGRTYDF